MESVGLDNTPPPSGASVLEEALAAPKSLTADDAAGVSDPGESAPSETGGAKVTLAELDTLVTALSFPLAANLEPAAELSMRSLAFGVGGAGGLGGGEGASSSDDWLDFFLFFAFSFFFFFGTAKPSSARFCSTSPSTSSTDVDRSINELIWLRMARSLLSASVSPRAGSEQSNGRL